MFVSVSHWLYYLFTKTTTFKPRYRTQYNIYSGLHAFGSDSFFVKNIYVILYRTIKHRSFPSLCIGDNQGTVWEFLATWGFRILVISFCKCYSRLKESGLYLGNIVCVLLYLDENSAWIFETNIRGDHCVWQLKEIVFSLSPLVNKSSCLYSL